MMNSKSHPELEDQNDRELLVSVSKQCRVSFAKLYRRYYTPLTRFAYRYLQAPEVIEEVVNDTMMVVWQKADSFRSESRVSTWIMGITVRKCWEAQKKASKNMQSIEELSDLEDKVCDSGNAELSQTMNWALQKLSPEHRATVELSYHMGYTCEEIASIMSCPQNTVKTRLHYARKSLRKILDTSESGLDYVEKRLD